MKERGKILFYWIFDVLLSLIKLSISSLSSWLETRLIEKVQSRPTISLILNWDLNHRSAFIFSIPSTSDAVARGNFPLSISPSFSILRRYMDAYPRDFHISERAFESSRSILATFLFVSHFSQCAFFRHWKRIFQQEREENEWKSLLFLAHRKRKKKR